MTQAGKDGEHSRRVHDHDCIRIPANWREMQHDMKAAITYNSDDPTTWERLGPLPFDQVNDGDLAEFCIGHEISFDLEARFWKKDDKNKYTAVCSDTLIHKNRTKQPEVKLALNCLNPSTNKVELGESEILIAIDETSKDPVLRRNCLREALRDTYGTSPTLTLQNILDRSNERGHIVGHHPEPTNKLHPRPRQQHGRRT